MHTETDLITLSHAPECLDGIVNMPACRASTILFPNYEAYLQGERGGYPKPSYGRYGNPTQTALEAALAQVIGADHTITYPSGMAAIAASLQAFVKTGDHVLMVDNVYAPSRRYCDQEFHKFGVEVTYYDPLVGADIAKLIKPNTRVIYMESPGSLTFEVEDIDAMVAAAKKAGALTIMDCTWATPLYFKPFDHGIDVVMHSATKYIAGHSDLLMGVLACKKEHYKTLLYTTRNLGYVPSADDCYLALRGLRTMHVRLKQHEVNALKVAAWLKTQPQVSEVFHPALPGAPGHDMWKKYFKGSCGLFSFQVNESDEKKIGAFVDSLKLFGIGFSWGGFESLIITSDLSKVRSATKWPHKGTLVRVHIGLEHVDDLVADLAQGLKKLG